VVDHRIETWSSQTKDYNICICCISVKHTALRRKNKNWFATSVYRETVVILDREDHLVLLEDKVWLDLLGQLDHKAQLVLMVWLDLMDHQGPLAPLGKPMMDLLEEILTL
jgi:hypothetical protein